MTRLDTVSERGEQCIDGYGVGNGNLYIIVRVTGRGQITFFTAGPLAHSFSHSRGLSSMMWSDQPQVSVHIAVAGRSGDG